MYDPTMVQPMRDELTGIGFKELKTAAEVDEAMQNAKGTSLLLVNSVCGCAAGQARPGIALALTSDTKPDNLFTVFAGQDAEADSVYILLRGHPCYVLGAFSQAGVDNLCPGIAQCQGDDLSADVMTVEPRFRDQEPFSLQAHFTILVRAASHQT